jgi:hypothetical protein
MSCVLSHPISGQILVLESGFPALLYTSLNNLNVDLNTGSRITLKSYSNLYVLESTDSANNVYPTEIGFVQNSGLPNGLGLYNYNTITGKINGTGIWNVATRYIYPNRPEPVSKIFTIVSKVSGGSINSYPLPNFETVFTGNGQPVFPINGPNGLEIPTENNGNITFTPITQEIIDSPFVESSGPTLENSNIPEVIENPETPCPEAEECPPDQGFGGGGWGGVEGGEGGGGGGGGGGGLGFGGAGGDPINYIAVRGFNNLTTTPEGVITGFNSFWAETRYVDTRTRTENYFLGRIGNRYVRVDTQTDRGFDNSQLGIIKGIKFSQGILTPSGNGYLPYGIETGSTTYFILTGLLPNNSISTSLIRKDLNGPFIDVLQNGTGISLGNLFPTGVPRLENASNFEIQINIGIENITALSLNWQVIVDNWRSINDAVLGGSYSSIPGDLLSYDQVGGSYIEHLNYTYELIPFTSNVFSQTGVSDFTGIQINEPWTTWGETLKWTELTPKTRHFYGLSWLMSRAWLNSSNGTVNENLPISGANFNRQDTGFEDSPIIMTNDITLDTTCPPVLNRCLGCDPTRINFTGSFENFNNSPLGNVSGAQMIEAFANCVGLVPFWRVEPVSTTSSQSLTDLLDLLEELN